LIYNKKRRFCFYLAQHIIFTIAFSLSLFIKV